MPPAQLDEAPAAPASEPELAALVSEANARRQPLAIEGSGSKRHHGPAVPPGCRRVTLRALAGVNHAPGDLVVSVLAGTRLTDVQRTLAEHRQWLPLDPPYPAATMGGILATGSAGPRRLGYGTVKDLLLGVRVMNAGGVVTRSGGRVVKNVSGFDLHRLQVGAFGALGILLEAHLKVSPRPAATGAVLLGMPDVPSALRLLLQVQASALRPVALEALDGGGIAPCRALIPEIPDAPAIALVGIEGSRALLDRHLRDLAPLRAQARSITVLEGSATDRLWHAFREAPGRTADQLTLRLGAPPHALPGLLERVLGQELPGAVRTGIACHAGTGIARLRFALASGLGTFAAALAPLGDAARATGGYLVAESAPLGLPGRAALPWAVAVNPLCRKIKQAWDPGAILNPGRLPL